MLDSAIFSLLFAAFHTYVSVLCSHQKQRCDCARSIVCFIGLNVDFTGVVSTVGGGGVLREIGRHTFIFNMAVV